MRYRIKEVVMGSGHVRYIPQYRYCGLWTNFEEGPYGCIEVEYATLDGAKAHIERDAVGVVNSTKRSEQIVWEGDYK